MNKVILIGNVVAAPEYKETGSGVGFCRFRLAVTKKYKNQDGSHDADFIDCQAWRQTAQYVRNYVVKGDKLCVEGSINVRQYTDDSGARKSSTTVMVENIDKLTPRQKIPAAPVPVENAQAGDSILEDVTNTFGDVMVEVEDDEGLPFD